VLLLERLWLQIGIAINVIQQFDQALDSSFQ
jgi:hypothetical protein